MAQITTWPIPSGPSGLAMRQQVNLITEALRTSNSGATAPTPTVAGMLWFDRSATPGVLKQRNSANDDWVAVAAPTPTSATGVAGSFQPVDSGVGTGLVLPAGGTWAYSLIAFNASNSWAGFNSGLQAGGGLIHTAATGIRSIGWAWRIA